jgi:signal peptidase I
MYKPNKWISGILGLIFQWLAFLYVARPKWAAFYFVVAFISGVVQFFYLGRQLVVQSFPEVFAAYAVPLVCAVHAFWIARRHDGIALRPRYTRWYGLVSILLGVLLGIVLFRIFFYEPFVLPSGAMLPTYKVGTHVVIEKSGFGTYHAYGITLLKARPSKKLYRGDVIVFKYPKDESLTYIKRIIGLPGDTVEYKNKRLTINNLAVPSSVINESEKFEIVEERFENKTFHVQHDQFRKSSDGVYTVPEDHYFMMGDNRDDSRDSRYWGFLPAENILGRVVFSIEP